MITLYKLPLHAYHKKPQNDPRLCNVQQQKYYDKYPQFKNSLNKLLRKTATTINS